MNNEEKLALLKKRVHSIFGDTDCLNCIHWEQYCAVCQKSQSVHGHPGAAHLLALEFSLSEIGLRLEQVVKKIREYYDNDSRITFRGSIGACVKTWVFYHKVEYLLAWEKIETEAAKTDPDREERLRRE